MRLCPENCIYRNRRARFCGYCLIDILADKNEREGGNDGNQQNEAEDSEQTQ